MSHTVPVMPKELSKSIPGEVSRALQEDLGDEMGSSTITHHADVTAMLIHELHQAHARNWRAVVLLVERYSHALPDAREGCAYWHLWP